MSHQRPPHPARLLRQRRFATFWRSNPIGPLDWVADPVYPWADGPRREFGWGVPKRLRRCSLPYTDEPWPEGHELLPRMPKP